MRSPLVVVFELDGFRHDLEQFTLKSIAVTCDHLELALVWAIQTLHLASRSGTQPVNLCLPTCFRPWLSVDVTGHSTRNLGTHGKPHAQ